MKTDNFSAIRKYSIIVDNSIYVICDKLLFVAYQSLPDISLPLEVYDYPIIVCVFIT